jgi:hypothetical protein
MLAFYCVGLGKIGIQSKGTFGSGEAVVIFDSLGTMQPILTECHQCPGKCIIWIDLGRAPAEANKGSISRGIPHNSGDIFRARHQVERSAGGRRSASARRTWRLVAIEQLKTATGG